MFEFLGSREAVVWVVPLVFTLQGAAASVAAA